MKLTVKTLKGSHFEIKALPGDTIMAVKKSIEDFQGKNNYPCGQQLLIHNGKVLKDETTLGENCVTEDGFIVVMLSKSKISGLSGTATNQPNSTNAIPESSSSAPKNNGPPSVATGANVRSDTISDAAASMLVENANMEDAIQQIMDLGSGNWDRATVMRALRAAYNNPERAVDYLYTGIPESAEIAIPISNLKSAEQPNSDPLNIFPQASSGGANNLSFLRENQQFQALRSMVQFNPEILQPMLEELGKQNPDLLRIITENYEEFLQLMNEASDASEGETPDENMPHTISVTEADQAAIRRLEELGFNKSLVIEAFIACDRNEQLAANYLLENASHFDD